MEIITKDIPIEDSKTPLYFLIIASLLNVILDLLFVITFKMGVSGAAIATIISQLVSGVLCLIYISKKFEILKLRNIIQGIVRIFAMLVH